MRVIQLLSMSNTIDKIIPHFWKQKGIAKMPTPIMLFASVITWPECENMMQLAFTSVGLVMSLAKFLNK